MRLLWGLVLAFICTLFLSTPASSLFKAPKHILASKTLPLSRKASSTKQQNSPATIVPNFNNVHAVHYLPDKPIATEDPTHEVDSLIGGLSPVLKSQLKEDGLQELLDSYRQETKDEQKQKEWISSVEGIISNYKSKIKVVQNKVDASEHKKQLVLQQIQQQLSSSIQDVIEKNVRDAAQQLQKFSNSNVDILSSLSKALDQSGVGNSSGVVEVKNDVMEYIDQLSDISEGWDDLDYQGDVRDNNGIGKLFSFKKKLDIILKNISKSTPK